MINLKTHFQRDELTFDHATHTYKWAGRPCVSVTTFISRFKQPFHAEEMAAKKALERGIRTADVLAEWEQERARAAAFGTQVHTLVAQSVAKRFAGQAVTEVPICLPSHLIAGTVDVIGYCADGTPVLVDWKTSKRLDVVGYHYMMPPLDNIFDSNWAHYCLQLSLYAHILRAAYNFDAKLLVLSNIQHDGTGQRHDVPEYKTAVQRLLHWRAHELFAMGGGGYDLNTDDT